MKRIRDNLPQYMGNCDHNDILNDCVYLICLQLSTTVRLVWNLFYYVRFFVGKNKTPIKI